jgi:hypothetical protein
MKNLDLQKRLWQAGYMADPASAKRITTALATKPVAGAFLFGPAGCGKTYLAETLAACEGGEAYFYQCFPGTREDDLLVKILPSETTISGVRLTDGVVSQAIRACRNGGETPVYLILDEWDKTRPSADSFLLDLLQSGRVNFNGHSAQLTEAQRARLRVFVTLNDEREISAPLRRRLPMISFEPLSPGLVRDALALTHEGHPYIGAAVILYERSLMAGWDEPATIQELRQLLDAVTCLGDQADWDMLVRQYVSKTAERHTLLAHVEGRRTDSQREAASVHIDPAAYEEPESDPPSPVTVPPAPTMPRLRTYPSVAEEAPGQIEGVTITPDLANAGGVIRLTDTAYDAVVGMAAEPADDPDQIGDVADVVGDVITLRRPIQLRDAVAPWGNDGEILLVEPRATAAMVLALRGHGLKIVRYTRTEILGRAAGGVDIRWTPDAGTEIIAPLADGRDILDRLGILQTRDRTCYCSQRPTATLARPMWRLACHRNRAEHGCRGLCDE